VALLTVNPHLANGVATFPDGQIKRHKDCLIICTANTWGNGANADYCGATKLDAAFMSRFPARLSWNIDKAFEMSIAGNETWAQRVQAADRDKFMQLGVRGISPKPFDPLTLGKQIRATLAWPAPGALPGAKAVQDAT
jgi:hypothetical protein